MTSLVTSATSRARRALASRAAGQVTVVSRKDFRDMDRATAEPAPRLRAMVETRKERTGA